MLLKNRLKFLMSYDKYCNGQGEYHIRSLYFDDFKSTALHEKLAGVLNRHKYRIRIYNKSSSVINLEKKIKRGGLIAKQKLSLSLNEYQALISDQLHLITLSNKPLLQELLIEMQASLLKPKVIVDYIREAYVSPLGNTRITFDKELRTGLRDSDILNPDLITIKALDNSYIIMEVKFDEYLPSLIQNLIQFESLTKQSASKYVICTKHIKNNVWEDS